ncbi:MAG TPA: YHS domain-containing protein [Gammaproteobacteria bacterium]|jgi:YHS domain-containing protein
MKKQKITKGFKRDPVCEMIVPEMEFPVEYRGMHFAFCSKQCRERFLEMPHLYIGYVGQKAPKQEGIEVIKNRKLVLSHPLDLDHEQKITTAVDKMMGMKKIHIKGRLIHVKYDLLQATLKQIEKVIENEGAMFSDRWVDRVKRNVVHFFEANECSGMSVGSGLGKSCH